MHNLSRLIITLAAALLASCASSARNQALDQKVAEESQVTSGRALEQKQDQLLAQTSNLTSEQRQQLDALKKSSHDKLAAINLESVKVRSVLIKDMLSDKPREREINAAKKRLSKLSDQRLDTIFDAANQANEILGRNRMIRDAMDIRFLEDNFNSY